MSRRSSRVRFSESGRRPISLASSSSGSGSVRRTSTSSANLGATAELDMIQARRLSRSSSSDHVRVPSPSDFAPRPLPMPRYNGPPAESYAPTSPKSGSRDSNSKRKSVRSRPSADGLRADLDPHRLSVPPSDNSRSYSTSSSSRSSMAGSSRRSSARFSIISDPQDLDMLSSLGGAPDIDDFFNQSLPSSLDVSLDLVSSPPPTVPLPSPSDSPSRMRDLAQKPFVAVTPPIQAPTRALSPVHGEDEKTPVPRPLAVFSTQQSTTTDTNMLTPGSTSDETPLARLARSPIGMAPLMAFPIPPPRAMSFEGLHSTLFDEIDKLVASEQSVLVSDIFTVGAVTGTLQPAPDLPVTSEILPISEQKAVVPATGSVDSDIGASETPTPSPTTVDVELVTTNDQELALCEEDPIPVYVSSESEDYEPYEVITDTDHTDTETENVNEQHRSSDRSLPSSPGVHELMTRFRGFQLESHESEGDDRDDEPDYEIPLYEAAVRAGILSSRSQLLWPSKPKRRTFIPPRFRLAESVSREESTGWSGSESEEEEFNEVLASIGRRKLAQKIAAASASASSSSRSSTIAGAKSTANQQQRLTPPKDHRASLRLSMISESSNSSCSTSASSIGILTPDPHRTKFTMGPYDPLNHTPTHTHTSNGHGHTGRLSIITSSWSASKASAGSALGIPVPTPVAIRRTKSFTRVLPVPKRQVKGWGKPEILLEDDEAPLINSSSEDEDSLITKRQIAPTSTSTSRNGKKADNNGNGDSSLGLTMDHHDGAEGGDEWLMNETEPEFIAGEFTLSVPPSRYLGIPF